MQDRFLDVKKIKEYLQESEAKKISPNVIEWWSKNEGLNGLRLPLFLMLFSNPCQSWTVLSSNPKDSKPWYPRAKLASALPKPGTGQECLLSHIEQDITSPINTLNLKSDCPLHCPSVHAMNQKGD